jgi:hypothetical protein
MRNKIQMIVALLAVMLIIGVASAANIKKVKLDEIQGNPNILDITVEVVNNGGVVTDVSTNDNNPLIKGNDGLWHGNNIPKGNGIVKIDAHDNNNNLLATRLYGSGGCTGNYLSHDKTYNFANVRPEPNSGIITTFYLDTYIPPYYNPTSPASIIGICVYPNPGFDRDIGELNIATALNTIWVPKHSGTHDYFGFGRIHGTDTIALSPARTIETGTVNYNTITGSDSSLILMHILDPIECAKGDNADDEEEIDGEPNNNPQTCWRRPGTPPPGIPEFPTVALPIAAVLGLVFFFQQKKKKEE